MSVLRDLAHFVCTASVTSLPESERAIQRRHVADTFVAATAGTLTSEGRALRTVLPHVSVADAIGLQVAVIRHTEIDDIHTRSCVTPSSVTVPTALSFARSRNEFDPDTVASAIWVGTELMTRLGVALNGARILYRGIWPTYFTAPLGAAAIAARIGKLNEEQTTHALSLALMLTAGRSGRFHGKLPGRSVILALAVANGVRAADAARQGVGGDPELLHTTWLKDAHGIEANLGALTTGLGTGSIYPQMTLKPFCSAKQAVASIEALMALIDEGLAPETISKVSVRVPPPYAAMIAMKPGLDSRSSTIVSAAFQMGLAAHHRARLYDIERAEALLEHAAMAFADKVEIAADESLLDMFPAYYPAEIDVTAGGKLIRRRVTAAYGDPTRPLDDAALNLKAERVWATPLMQGRSRAKTVVALGLAGLQDRDACKRLADAMWVACAA
jgi:2-methylcitrate dehydratase PrpD